MDQNNESSLANPISSVNTSSRRFLYESELVNQGCILPHFNKLKNNLEEVKARGGKLFIIADQGFELQEDSCTKIITLGDHAGFLSPILHVIPLQLLAYHVANSKGNDVDKPRNLAKSVTVE